MMQKVLVHMVENKPRRHHQHGIASGPPRRALVSHYCATKAPFQLYTERCVGDGTASFRVNGIAPG